MQNCGVAAEKVAADIWVVVKDPGGTNAVLPIYDDLLTRGFKALLIANGKAVELLEGNKRPHLVAESAEELIATLPLPKILITSMCSQGGVGRDLVPILRKAGVIIFTIQDFWGARLWTDWSNPRYRPDFILVNDEVGKKIVLTAWPEYEPDRVKITGYAALDKYAGYDVDAAAAKARTTLGLNEDLPVVLFGGQGSPTGHALGEVVAALNGLGRDYYDHYLIPRPHPRTKNNFQSEMQPWQEALAKFRYGRIVVDWFDQTNTQELIALCKSRGVVVSMFSTILVEAASLGVQNISALYPDHGMKRLLSELQGVEEFPLVALGCSAKATNRAGLRKLLQDAFECRLGLEKTQAECFKLDGKNAARAGDFIAGLMK